jgi:hypothetical protein
MAHKYLKKNSLRPLLFYIVHPRKSFLLQVLGDELL